MNKTCFLSKKREFPDDANLSITPTTGAPTPGGHVLDGGAKAAEAPEATVAAMQSPMGNGGAEAVIRTQKGFDEDDVKI